MPELPEVETVVRTLERQIKGQKIEDIKIIYPKIVDNCSLEYFRNELIGKSFNKFDRRGKFLVFTIGDNTLVVHLRMEGKFFIYPKDYDEVNKHTHIIFYLSDFQLHYNDVRKFGRFYLYKENQELDCLAKLGYEPFDCNLTGSYLKKFNKNNKQKIKTQLLDQSMITGIGNIYADEICYLADINPLREDRFISEEKWDKIIDSTREVLSQAISQGGTTIRSYTSSLGVTGRFQQSLLVHSREDEPCKNCGSTILRQKVNGRSTYYCPKCQKEKCISIAITGSIGSGKSTVTKLLQELGKKTISCDQINSQLLKDETVISKLVSILEISREDFSKEKMASIIFNNKEIKEKAESYLHNLIWENVSSFIKDNEEEQFVFVEVPLLFETDWYRKFDFNVVVSVSDEILYTRLKENRKMSEKQIKERLDSQLDSETKKQLADYVIVNDKGLKQLKEKVSKMLDELNR